MLRESEVIVYQILEALHIRIIELHLKAIIELHLKANALIFNGKDALTQ